MIGVLLVPFLVLSATRAVTPGGYGTIRFGMSVVIGDAHE